MTSLEGRAAISLRGLLGGSFSGLSTDVRAAAAAATVSTGTPPSCRAKSL